MKNEYDLLKSVTILLVVVGHVTNHYADHLSVFVTKAIYLFHMPLFIAISGAIFMMGCEKGKYKEFVPFLKNKMLRIGVPFVFTACVILVPTLMLTGLTKMSYGRTVLNMMSGGWCVKHLWYLQALFWIFIIAWCLRKARVNLIFAFSMSTLMAVARSELNITCSFGLGMCIEYLPMFIAGMWLVDRGRHAQDKFKFIFGSAFAIVFAAVQKFGDIHLVDNIIRFLLPASIIVVIHVASRFALPRLQDASFLKFILKQSFGIYLFHMSFIYILRTRCCETRPSWLVIPATIVFALGGSIALTLALRALKLEWMIGEKKRLYVGESNCAG